MRRIRTVVALAATVAVTMASPAGAQDAPELESYRAGASATALNLQVLGQDITLSGTSAAVSSGPEAKADGRALTTPLFSTEGAPSSSTSGAHQNADCIELDLPAPVDLVGVDIVCVRTSTAVSDDGSPLASSTSDELVLEVSAGSLLSTTPLGDVVETIQNDLLGAVFDLLAPVTDPVADLGIDIEGVIDGLIDEIQAGTVLARVRVAPTASTAGANPTDGVIASATSNGVVVEVLPALGPLVTATVGASSSSVVLDPVTGDPTPTGQASLLQVQFAPNLLGLLSDLGNIVNDVLAITVDQLGCNDSNPLAGVICFSAGSTKALTPAELEALGLQYGDDTVGQQSSVLQLRVLGLLGNDALIDLAVGQTQAAASATPGEIRQVPEEPEEALPTPEVRTSLPKTGGSPLEGPAGIALALAVTGAATGGLVFVRRLRAVA